MRSVAASLLLVALVAGASAFDLGDWPEDVVSAMKTWGGESTQAQALSLGDFVRSSEEEEEKEFALALEFHVPPHLACEFAHASLQVHKELKEVEGVRHFQASKHLTDNTHFCMYEVWESKEKFMQHMHKEDSECKRFLHFINAMDIRVTMTRLMPIEAGLPSKGVSRSLHPNRGRIEFKRSTNADIVSDAMAAAQSVLPPDVANDGCHVSGLLIKLLVKPSSLEGLSAQVQKLQEATRSDAGNIVTNWSWDALTDNTVFGYLEWEKESDIKSFLSSSHFQAFRNWVLKNDLLMFKDPVKAICKFDAE